MALFDPNTAKSEEANGVYVCRQLMSTCPTMQELCETTGDAAATLTKIWPGLADPPQDCQGFTVAELEQQLVWANLHPHFEEAGLLVARSKAVAAVSEKEGFLKWQMRRQVRDAEYNAASGRWDVFMYFLDRTSRVCEELVELAELNFGITQIKRTAGPLFNHKDDVPTQGRFIWADFLIRWGGSENAE